MQNGNRFKVYVIDRAIPDMNGIETGRGIRKLAGEDKSIILLTAYDWIDIEKEAREAGVSGFISKPLFPSGLRKALLQACGITTPDQKNKEEQFYSLKGKKILMVDDNELNLRIGSLQLQRQGVTFETALNGQTAVNIIRENGADAYDMVLMGVQMPGMDGYETTSVIRKLPDGDKLKILAFSANAFDEDKERSLKAGIEVARLPGGYRVDL